jgi:triacylglycerol lipase
VVLAHGLLGFDEIRVGGRTHDYFRGVRTRLEDDGVELHRPCVARTAAIAARAEELAEFIRALPARRVNVVAHSMGGLDARYAISRLGLGRKVASLTTIGTPHLGTPIADLGAGLTGRARVLDALAALGVDLAAFQDLTTARMAAFNAAVPDARGVAYASVVGVAGGLRGLNPLLVPTWLWLSERAGESDGVVPATSQRWGEVVRTVAADHWAQIGWSKGFDAAELYVELLRELRGRGF